MRKISYFWFSVHLTAKSVCSLKNSYILFTRRQSLTTGAQSFPLVITICLFTLALLSEMLTVSPLF